MGLMLRFGWVLVAKSNKGLFEVAGHAAMDALSFLVPVEGQAKVAGALPIGVAAVVLFDDFKEMFDVNLVDVLYPKIVNNKGNADGAPRTGPIAWCQLTLAVSVNVEAFF